MRFHPEKPRTKYDTAKPPWFVVPTGHSVRSRSRSSCRNFMAEPFSDDVAGHPNRTEKRLIFRHNAIPRNDFCTVSPFSYIMISLQFGTPSGSLPVVEADTAPAGGRIDPREWSPGFKNIGGSSAGAIAAVLTAERRKLFWRSRTGNLEKAGEHPSTWCQKVCNVNHYHITGEFFGPRGDRNGSDRTNFSSESRSRQRNP